MESADGAHVVAHDVAASHQAACSSLFKDVELLSGQAADYLALLSTHADAADAQKLRTAALKMRLAELTRERRSREAAMEAVMSKQKELDRLLQQEQEHQPASAAPPDMMQSPFNTPISTTS